MSLNLFNDISQYVEQKLQEKNIELENINYQINMFSRFLTLHLYLFDNRYIQLECDLNLVIKDGKFTEQDMIESYWKMSLNNKTFINLQCLLNEIKTLKK